MGLRILHDTVTNSGGRPEPPESHTRRRAAQGGRSRSRIGGNDAVTQDLENRGRAIVGQPVVRDHAAVLPERYATAFPPIDNRAQLGRGVDTPHGRDTPATEPITPLQGSAAATACRD